MELDDETIVYNERTLKKVIFSAVLMSLIDGELHEKEWDVIESFADKYWREEYDLFYEYEKEVKKEIGAIVADESVLMGRIDGIVEQLVSQLDSPQKNEVLNLVGDVMTADGVMTLEESKLFALFMEKIGIRIF
ncbi:MAG: hypothetical protein GY866_28895 [Proteobacteria bacterium]|nr:hypothetical protein [Pseudomonadota bacterium]